MSTQSVGEARAFVQQTDLPAPPPEVLGPSIAATPFEFDTAKEQASRRGLGRHLLREGHLGGAPCGKVTINSSVLGGVRDDIAKKLAAHTREFVAGLDV